MSEEERLDGLFLNLAQQSQGEKYFTVEINE